MDATQECTVKHYIHRGHKHTVAKVETWQQPAMTAVETDCIPGLKARMEAEPYNPLGHAYAILQNLYPSLD